MIKLVDSMKYLKIRINTQYNGLPKSGRIYISDSEDSWDKFIDFDFSEIHENVLDFGKTMISPTLKFNEKI